MNPIERSTHNYCYHHSTKKWLLIVIIMSLAAVICSFVLRNGLLHLHNTTTVVSVKGLAEKAVKADYAVWVIPLTAVDNDLEAARSKIENDVAKITAYLATHNILNVEPSTMKVFDRQAQKYFQYEANIQPAPKFVIDHQLVIKTNDVDAVQRASKGMNGLLSEGVALAYDGYSTNSHAPRYLFTKLNDIKPEMLSIAMQEAGKALVALNVLQDQQHPKISHVTQGMFSVYARDESAQDQKMISNATPNEGDRAESYFIDKIVRVVVSVDYSIK